MWCVVYVGAVGDAIADDEAPWYAPSRRGSVTPSAPSLRRPLASRGARWGPIADCAVRASELQFIYKVSRSELPLCVCSRLLRGLRPSDESWGRG